MTNSTLRLGKFHFLFVPIYPSLSLSSIISEHSQEYWKRPGSVLDYLTQYLPVPSYNTDLSVNSDM